MYRLWQKRVKLCSHILGDFEPTAHLLPGVDVMITIFCNFRQFSATKLAFFSKTNVMIKFLQKLAVVWAKNTNIFAKILAKIFLNHNIGSENFGIVWSVRSVRWNFFFESRVCPRIKKLFHPKSLVFLEFQLWIIINTLNEKNRLFRVFLEKAATTIFNCKKIHFSALSRSMNNFSLKLITQN
jgi:hypothetical protein